jgi:hypothetical protein
MLHCVECNREYDEEEVCWDFGDILMEKYGYQGDILEAAASSHCYYGFCAECLDKMFEGCRDEFEDGVSDHDRLDS